MRGTTMGLGVAACAVCCAAPLIALLGITGGGLIATAATFAFAGSAFGLVVGAATVAGVVYQRRHRPVSRETETETDQMLQLAPFGGPTKNHDGA